MSPGFSLLLLLPAALILALLLRRRRRGKAPVILIDGSNVLYWRDNAPSLVPLQELVARLRQEGFSPGVVFDANVGYRLEGRYRDDADLARRLGLPAERVLVVPKGQPADPVILAVAKENGARIVTNDRYRDWAAAHPEVAEPGRLIRGGYRDGRLWLALDQAPRAPLKSP